MPYSIKHALIANKYVYCSMCVKNLTNISVQAKGCLGLFFMFCCCCLNYENVNNGMKECALFLMAEWCLFIAFFISKMQASAVITCGCYIEQKLTWLQVILIRGQVRNVSLWPRHLLNISFLKIYNYGSMYLQCIDWNLLWYAFVFKQCFYNLVDNYNIYNLQPKLLKIQILDFPTKIYFVRHLIFCLHTSFVFQYCQFCYFHMESIKPILCRFWWWSGVDFNSYCHASYVLMLVHSNMPRFCNECYKRVHTLFDVIPTVM